MGGPNQFGTNTCHHSNKLDQILFHLQLFWDFPKSPINEYSDSFSLRQIWSTNEHDSLIEIKLNLLVIKLEKCGIIVKSLYCFTYLSKSEPGGKRAGYFKAGCRDINTTHKSVCTTTYTYFLVKFLHLLDWHDHRTEKCKVQNLQNNADSIFKTRM